MAAISNEAAQAAVVADLEAGVATGDAGPLVRVDTHMSRVFLARERVYKLKRARTHPFVDLADPERRRRACLAEIEVNHALAPGVYERVAPVVREEGGYRIDGPGEAVDWVVVMKRLPDDSLLDAKARAGRLDGGLAADAARAIAGFHAGLPPAPSGGGLEDYRRIVEGLRSTWAQAYAALGANARQAAPVLPTIFVRLDDALARAAPLIEARRRAGRVRRGHGDLHLGNICVLEGRVTPFDALEFDPAMATGDVLYDLAFLLMDLRARRLSDAANAAMNAYWDAAGEAEVGLGLLPVFMALRAAVRMAVALEAGDPGLARRDHALARRLLRPAAPRLLAVGGLSGTGKSVLSARLAPRLPGACGARWLRTDVIRKQAAGAPADQPLGPAAYGAAARAAIYRRMIARARESLAAGTSVVADATFRSAAQRRAIPAAAEGRPFLGIWLQAEQEQRLGRIARRTEDPSDITVARAARQIEPATLDPAWRRLSASGSASTVAARGRRQIADWLAEPPVQTPGEAS